jgi:hypothetical protein
MERGESPDTRVDHAAREASGMSVIATDKPIDEKEMFAVG